MIEGGGRHNTKAGSKSMNDSQLSRVLEKIPLIVLFDGVCHFCSSTVQWIIQRDIHDRFRFTPLQSQTGLTILDYHHQSHNINTVVLIFKNKVFIKSNAILEICFHLGGFYKCFYIFKLIPTFIRNWGYDIFAKHRYQFFGRDEHCMMPDPKINYKFLDINNNKTDSKENFS